MNLKYSQTKCNNINTLPNKNMIGNNKYLE